MSDPTVELLKRVMADLQLAGLLRAAAEDDLLLANALNVQIAFSLGLVLSARHPEYTQALLHGVAAENVESHRSLLKMADALPKLHPIERVEVEEPV